VSFGHVVHAGRDADGGALIRSDEHNTRVRRRGLEAERHLLAGE